MFLRNNVLPKPRDKYVKSEKRKVMSTMLIACTGVAIEEKLNHIARNKLVSYSESCLPGVSMREDERCGTQGTGAIISTGQ
jgi:hypothetical protein